MAIWSQLGLSGPAAGAGGALVVLLGVGGYLGYQSMPSQETPDAPELAFAVPDPKPAESKVAAPEPQVAEPEPEVLPEPEPEVALAEPEPEATPEPKATPDPEPEVVAAPEPQYDTPAFDVVQVQPDGGGVLAGRAVPQREVVFYLDGAEFARTTADRNGKFGLVLDFPFSDAPRALSMASVLENGQQIPSDGTLLISPVRAPAPEVAPEPETAVAEAEPEPTPEPEVEVAAQVDPAPVPTPEPLVETEAAPAPAIEVVAIEPQTEPEPETQSTAEAAPEEPQVPTTTEAPAIVLATNEGVTVLQPAPQPAAPQRDDTPVVANVVIDTITYDSTGDVALSGRGASDGFVRVYLNGEPIKTSQIAEDGSWRAPLPDVDAGVYSLRIDEVNAQGAVTSRVETPFQREEPDVVASTPAGPQAVIVQPGFTLWAIARDKFGAGEQYVRVYEANRDLIRNPDLIYPGQVFAIPEG